MTQSSPPIWHPEESQLYTLFDRLGIGYQCIEHQPVFTCDDSEGLEIEIPGAHTKQLLLRDKKKHHYVLAIVMHDKTVDIRALGDVLGISRMSFASPDDLQNFLRVTPGAVTPFGLLFDTEKKVRVVIDEDAWNTALFRFHPLRNSATVVINQEGFVKFLEETRHGREVIAIPCQRTS